MSLIRFAQAAALAVASTQIGPAAAKLPHVAQDESQACVRLAEVPRLVGAPARLQPIPDRYVKLWYAALNDMAGTSLSGHGMLVAVLSVPPHDEESPAVGSGVIFVATAGCITNRVTLDPQELRHLARDVHARSAARTAHRGGEGQPL